MSATDLQQLGLGVVQGLASSTVFILALFIGFCVLVGLTKLKKTAGGVTVIKSLDEQMTHKPAEYLRPSAPHGPTDQLRSPELLEAAARK